MKQIFLSIILFFSLMSIAQKNPVLYKISYKQISNGEESKNGFDIKYYDGVVYLSDTSSKIQSFSNLKEREIVKVIKTDEGLFKVVTPFDSLPKPKPIDKDEKILKYKCKSVSYLYFSNTIEVWYTEKSEAKGSPYSKFLPNPNALVLKVVVNGNNTIQATSIEKIKKFNKPNYLPAKAKEVDDARFQELEINSRFTKLNVFNDEQIYFDGDFKKPNDKNLELNKVYHFSKGSVIIKKIKLPELAKNCSYVIAELSAHSNGDAYDRTGTVFIIPQDGLTTMLDAYQYGIDTLPTFMDKRDMEYQGFVRTQTYEPPIELIRFFTAFGVGHFNHNKIHNYNWADEAVYKQDVTKLIPNNTDEIIVGVFIGNYDRGGHKVSLDLNFYPNDEENDSLVKFIEPLFLTVNTMEMEGQNYGRLFKTDTLTDQFEIKDSIQDLELLFTTTGHGGWGTGDEFVQKLNQVFIDGQKVFNIIPWRTDCATYRMSNPASGNFSVGLSSSDLSRSNWCPGTLTPPYVIPLQNLSIGKHTIKVVINQGDDVDGGNCAWSVSGVLVGKHTK